MICRRRAYTVALPNGQGPSALQIQLSHGDQAELDIEAWTGSVGTVNAYIFQGALTVADCQARFQGGATSIDAIMTVPGSGRASAPMENANRLVTVFFEAANASGSTESVTLIVTERTPE